MSQMSLAMEHIQKLPGDLASRSSMETPLDGNTRPVERLNGTAGTGVNELIERMTLEWMTWYYCILDIMILFYTYTSLDIVCRWICYRICKISTRFMMIIHQKITILSYTMISYDAIIPSVYTIYRSDFSLL